MDAGRRRGDEPLRDRVRRHHARKWGWGRGRARTAVVHAQGRGGAVRARHACERPRPLGESAGSLPTEPARFRTASGCSARRCRVDGAIELDFPALPTSPSTCPTDSPRWSARRSWRPRERARPARRARGRIDGARVLTPDIAAIARLDVRGVAVTARGEPDSGFDFVSRFGPRAGVAEDPVTGSAHCACSCRTGPSAWGRRASPLSGVPARRRRTVPARAPDRVLLGGAAVTVWHGTLT